MPNLVVVEKSNGLSVPKVPTLPVDRVMPALAALLPAAFTKLMTVLLSFCTTAAAEAPSKASALIFWAASKFKVSNTTCLGTTALAASVCMLRFCKAATLLESCTASLAESATVDCTAFSTLAMLSRAAMGSAAVEWILSWSLASLSLLAVWPTTVVRAVVLVTDDALRAWVNTVVTALTWLKSKPDGLFLMEVTKLVTTAAEKSSEPALLAL